jgi:hypothetical protein
MGKGSRPRPYSVSQAQFGANYDTIFGSKKMTPRVEETKEIGSCGCGRSPTGKCIGWHGLSEDEFQKRLAEHQAQNK